MESTICQCNKCNVVLIDHNPQVNAPLYELKGDELELEIMKDKDGFTYVCPICKTDGNLQDNITIKQY